MLLRPILTRIGLACLLLLSTIATEAMAQSKAPRPDPGYIGVHLHEVTQEKAEDLGWREPRGVLVTWATPGFPGLVAGLLPWDVVVAVDGRLVNSAREFITLISAKGAGSKVALSVVREGRDLLLTAELTRRPADKPLTEELLRLGDRIDKLNADEKYAEAIPYAEQFLRGVESFLGSRHLTTAQALFNVGDLYNLVGRKREAEPILRRSLSIFEQAGGPTIGKTADVSQKLAHLLYFSLGQHPDAEELFERAIDINGRTVGRQHNSLASPLHNLAIIKWNRAKPADAETLYRRALAIRERAGGADTEEFVGTLNELAQVVNEQGRRSEAKSLYQRELAIRLRAKGHDDIGMAMALHNLANILDDEHSYVEAEALLLRAIALKEKHYGRETEAVAVSLNSLANVYRDVHRLPEAEALHRRSLEIREKRLDSTHRHTADTLYNLGNVLVDQRKFDEAVARFEKALAIYKAGQLPRIGDVAKTLSALGRLESARGSGAAEVRYLEAIAACETRTPACSSLPSILSNLGVVYLDLGRHELAETTLRRALAILESIKPSDTVELATVLQNLGEILRERAAYDEAQVIFRRALAIRQQVLGPRSADVASTLSSLGNTAMQLGRTDEAEGSLRKSLEVREEVYGQEDLEVAKSLNDLGVLYWRLGRLNDAGRLFTRSQQIREVRLPPGHNLIAQSLGNLAGVYKAASQLEKARTLYVRVLAMDEKNFAADHPTIAARLEAIANIDSDQDNFAAAEPLYRRALAIRERAHGADHPRIALSLHNLAVTYRRQHRYEEAAAHAQRRLDILTRLFGPDHPEIADTHALLGSVYSEAKRWALSYEHNAIAASYWLARGNSAEIRQQANHFYNVVRSTLNYADENPQRAESLREDAFVMGQWATLTAAGSALAQMAARVAADEPSLASLARQRQDVADRWMTVDHQLVTAMSSSKARRESEHEAALRNEINLLKSQAANLDARLAAEFPAFAALASPSAVPLAEVQALLAQNEAMIVFIAVMEECYAWLITPTYRKIARIPLAYRDLDAKMDALRCGLDVAVWRGSVSKRCTEVLAFEPQRDGRGEALVDTLPFDLSLAHDVYKRLFGVFDAEIRDKSLLIAAPPGPLSSIPFGTLVTEAVDLAVPKEITDYRKASWLGHRQPITVLPSVAALKALRQLAKPSRASKPFLGIANPLLTGQPDAHPEDRARAERSAALQNCVLNKQNDAAVVAAVRSLEELQGQFRSSSTDIEHVRKLPPLPESADEVCAIARTLGADDPDVLLGARASEANLKDRSERGELAQYRIIQFATHGVLSGQIQGASEPGLILTPPAQMTTDAGTLARDNGYLSASEVAALKLDAEWIILSACNTAGGGGDSSEALSGLSRAFFYAGARSVLVSHWEVISDAAVKLTTQTLTALRANPQMGRAEALRASMRELVKAGEPWEAHPAIWAPFILVGEGGSNR